MDHEDTGLFLLSSGLHSRKLLLVGGRHSRPRLLLVLPSVRSGQRDRLVYDASDVLSTGTRILPKTATEFC
jgi:hypothetical protein